MEFCVVQRDLDRHLAELSRLEALDASREEIRQQSNIIDSAFAMTDDTMFRDVVAAAAREILNLLGEI